MCPTGSPLMGGATSIPDSYMTASSYRDSRSDFAPYQARRQDNSFAWCPSGAERDAAVPAMWFQARATVYHIIIMYIPSSRSVSNMKLECLGI